MGDFHNLPQPYAQPLNFTDVRTGMDSFPKDISGPKLKRVEFSLTYEMAILSGAMTEAVSNAHCNPYYVGCF